MAPKFLIGGFILFTIASCSTYKNIPYFQDFGQSGTESIKARPYLDLIIQPDDILSITVKTLDESTSKELDFSSSAMPNIPTDLTPMLGTPAPVSQVSGYLVDKNGDVDVPFVSRVHLAGLTRMQAKDTIEYLMKRIFKNPVVDVRFANFKVTVIGEVLHPASFNVPNEKINVFDALGLAGDLTVFGKRENVILMRDSGEFRTLVRLNLNSKNIISSPYFYLRQNDILYVEPNNAKIANLDAAQTRKYTIIASILTVLVIVASRINF